MQEIFLGLSREQKLVKNKKSLPINTKKSTNKPKIKSTNLTIQKHNYLHTDVQTNRKKNKDHRQVNGRSWREITE